ncbi:MAG: YchJ family metal-binding protein [Nocardioides sp.]
MKLQNDCPCGTGLLYDDCCGRLHRGAAQAINPEQLMRSRYSAYVVGDVDHVFRTWHPRTRPDDVSVDPAVRWTRLQVLEATDTEVEFAADYELHGATYQLHERSTFEQRGGRWVYVAAVRASTDSTDS